MDIQSVKYWLQADWGTVNDRRLEVECKARREQYLLLLQSCIGTFLFRDSCGALAIPRERGGGG